MHPLRHLTPGALFLAILVMGDTTAHAESAQCRVDLDRGRFGWSIPGQEPWPVIEVDHARARFARLDSLLRAGDPADNLRATLGTEILGPVWDRLAGIDDWRIIAASAEPVPGPVAAFSTLTLPTEASGPALARYRVSFAGPRSPDPAAGGNRPSSGELLLSAPFAPGIDSAHDDPDTLRQALGRAVRTVRLIPRNETGASTLRRALGESRPGLWWFRGESGQLDELQPAFEELPPVIVWTLPSRSVLAVADLSALFTYGGRAPRTMIVASRAVPETRLAPLVRSFVDGLARGLECGEALHQASLRALENGSSLGVASALVLVGDPAARGPLKRAPWLRRIRG